MTALYDETVINRIVLAALLTLAANSLLDSGLALHAPPDSVPGPTTDRLWYIARAVAYLFLALYLQACSVVQFWRWARAHYLAWRERDIG